jgi:hypothetical protein
MYDVNPLGPLMHLKELERQAISAAQRVPAESRSNITARVWEKLAIVLQRMSSSNVARRKEI